MRCSMIIRLERGRLLQATRLTALLLAAALSLPPCRATLSIERRLIVKMRGQEAVALSTVEAAALEAPAAAAGGTTSSLLAQLATRSIPHASGIPDLVAALQSRQGACLPGREVFRSCCTPDGAACTAHCRCRPANALSSPLVSPCRCGVCPGGPSHPAATLAKRCHVWVSHGGCARRAAVALEP